MFAYIPPPDSEHYSHDSFASVQEKVKVSNSEEFCFIGDLNARFGTRMRNMPRVFGTMKNIRTRTFLVECLRAQNENASILASVCEESKLLVLNNFKTPVE